MFKPGDYIIYKKDVCKIKDIKRKGKNNLEYYVLSPVDDESLIINVLTDYIGDDIRPLVNKKDLEKLINDIPNIPIIDCDERMLEREYRLLFASGDLIDLIKIIKTTYRRNKERIAHNKKITDRDDNFFNKAEKRLYIECSIVLGKTFDETKKYIVEKVHEVENHQ